MKKQIFLLVTVTLLWLATNAEASYIYDWVSTSLNPNDCGSRVEASWLITDAEYKAGVFSTLNPGDSVTSSVEMISSDRSSMWNVGLWGAEWTGVSGILNNAEDKTRILSIYWWEASSDALFFAEATGDIGWSISADRMWGNYYGAGDHLEWDRNGEWVLREPDNTVPVPEPSSVFLLIFGVAAVGIKRCRAAKAICGAQILHAEVRVAR